MLIYLKDGTHLYISDDEFERLSCFVYDCWGNKDYEMTVQRDWGNFDDKKIEVDVLQQQALVKSLKANESMSLDKIESLGLFLDMTARIELGDYPYEVLSHFKSGEEIKATLVNKKQIATILDKFTEDVITRICDVFGSYIHLNELWRENTYMDNKMKMAVDMKKDLDKTINVLEKQISKCEESANFPEIVLRPMQEAIELATSYRNLLMSEIKKSRYKADGNKYSALTSKNEWNGIILDTVTILEKGICQNYKIDECRRHSLTAKLLAEVFPWCWGQLSANTATKRVRERFKPTIE